MIECIALAGSLWLHGIDINQREIHVLVESIHVIKPIVGRGDVIIGTEVATTAMREHFILPPSVIITALQNCPESQQ